MQLQNLFLIDAGLSIQKSAVSWYLLYFFENIFLCNFKCILRSNLHNILLSNKSAIATYDRFLIHAHLTIQKRIISLLVFLFLLNKISYLLTYHLALTIKKNKTIIVVTHTLAKAFFSVLCQNFNVLHPLKAKFCDCRVIFFYSLYFFYCVDISLRSRIEQSKISLF